MNKECLLTPIFHFLLLIWVWVTWSNILLLWTLRCSQASWDIISPASPPSVFFLCSHLKKCLRHFTVFWGVFLFIFFYVVSFSMVDQYRIRYKMLCISTFVPKSFKLLIGPHFFVPQRIKDSVFFSCCLYKVNIFFLYEPSVFIFHANCAWLLNLDVADWSFYVRNLLWQALCLLTAMCLVWFYVYKC